MNHHPPPDSQLGIDFDAAASAVARDEAISRVASGSSEWQQDALLAVHELCRRQPELTTDDLWRVLERPDDLEPRAAGAVMRRAVRAGLIERTDRTRKSARVACHRRDLRVWRSLRYGGSNEET